MSNRQEVAVSTLRNRRLCIEQTRSNGDASGLVITADQVPLLIERLQQVMSDLTRQRIEEM